MDKSLKKSVKIEKLFVLFFSLFLSLKFKNNLCPLSCLQNQDNKKSRLSDKVLLSIFSGIRTISIISSIPHRYHLYASSFLLEQIHFKIIPKLIFGLRFSTKLPIVFIWGPSQRRAKSFTGFSIIIKSETAIDGAAQRFPIKSGC